MAPTTNMSDILPTFILFVLAVALLFTPPTGYNAKLPTELPRSVSKAPGGNAFWTPPASSHWSTEKHTSMTTTTTTSSTSYAKTPAPKPLAVQQEQSKSELIAADDEFMKERVGATHEFHMLISQEHTELATIARARQLLSLKKKLNLRRHIASSSGNDNDDVMSEEFVVDCLAPLSVPQMRPQGVMVRLIDIFSELNHHNHVLSLMNEFIKCGGDINPSEPESGIDVITRAVSIGSLHAASLLVGNGGKVKVSKYIYIKMISLSNQLYPRPYYQYLTF
jgi:hypothetical protein